MPTHERQAIREAVIDQLIGDSPYNTSAGLRVTKSRMAPHAQAQLPAISVYTDDESVDPASRMTAPRELKRTVQLAIEAWVVADADVDDALDAIALQIETAMDADLEFDETAYSSVLASTETGIKLDGNRPMGAVRMVYTVVYHTDLRTSVADAAMDEFDEAGINFDLSSDQDEDDQASDLLEDIHE